MTPKEAAIELEKDVRLAIERYEKAAPGGVCVGIFVDRVPGGFKVKPRLRSSPTGA